MRNGPVRGRVEDDARKTISNVFNNSLLNIYISTVKTGSQQEIE